MPYQGYDKYDVMDNPVDGIDATDGVGYSRYMFDLYDDGTSLANALSCNIVSDPPSETELDAWMHGLVGLQ